MKDKYLLLRILIIVGCSFFLGFKTAVITNTQIKVSPGYIYEWEPAMGPHSSPELIAYPENRYHITKIQENGKE